MSKTTHPRCPACGRVQECVVITDDGQIEVEGVAGKVILTGFVCHGCGKPTNWKVQRRGVKNTLRKVRRNVGA